MKKIVCLICTLAMIVGVISAIPASAAVIEMSPGGASPIAYYDSYYAHINKLNPPKFKPSKEETGVNENGEHVPMGYINSPKDENFWAVAYNVPFKGALNKDGKPAGNWFLFNDEGAGIYGKGGAFDPTGDPILNPEEYLAFTLKMRTIPGKKVVIRPKLVFTISATGEMYEFDWMNGSDGCITIDNTDWKAFGYEGTNVQGYFDVREADYNALYKQVKALKEAAKKAGKAPADIDAIKHGFQVRFYNESTSENAWVEVMEYDMALVTTDSTPKPNATMNHPDIPKKDAVVPPPASGGTDDKESSGGTSDKDTSSKEEEVTDTRIIAGTVLDKDGKAVSGATVKFGDTLTATTDKNGKFNVQGVKAGTYKCVITDKDGTVIGEQEYVVEFGDKAAVAAGKITTDKVGASLKIKIGADKAMTAEIDTAAAPIVKPKDPTKPGTSSKDTNGKSASSLLWLWIVIGAVVVLGGLFCLYWFVIRPKMAAKAAGEITDDNSDNDNTPDNND
ncbi:MAG: carboxypeptidase-like regulatory domain-containing protein, partial [Oscillospiraceae bacterium]